MEGYKKIHFYFVRYCLSTDGYTLDDFCGIDWNTLFSFMKQQALLGVGFCGVERMKKEGVDVPRQTLLKWYSLSEKIKKRNEVMNQRCVELCQYLQGNGIQCCILKGQGNAMMYPEPLLRASGDIDVWVEGSRKDIIGFVRSSFPHTEIRYHHVDFPYFKDATVEVHFMPSSMNNPVYNRRLQQWFEEKKEKQFCHFVELPDGVGTIPVPTDEFNLVYQMSHMMHHFFDEGIGLRQMMDYYYLLRKANDELVMDKGQLRMTLRFLNLYQFAGAVMYVMREVFGLEEKMMIVPVDERRGKTLMDEILKGGNFGKHSGLTQHSTGVKYFLKIRRNMRFVREYPAEALCEPWFRTWHFFWRLWNK